MKKITKEQMYKHRERVLRAYEYHQAKSQSVSANTPKLFEHHLKRMTELFEVLSEMRDEDDEDTGD